MFNHLLENRIRFFLPGLLIALSIVLSGCASSPNSSVKSKVSMQTIAPLDEASIQSLLSTAEFAAQPKANKLRLQAAKIALQGANIEQAEIGRASCRERV